MYTDNAKWRTVSSVSRSPKNVSTKLLLKKEVLVINSVRLKLRTAMEGTHENRFE